jgi:hypothetical protein
MSTANQFSVLAEEPEVKLAAPAAFVAHATVPDNERLTDPINQLNNSFERNKHFPDTIGFKLLATPINESLPTSVKQFFDSFETTKYSKNTNGDKPKNYSKTFAVAAGARSYPKTTNPNFENDEKKEMNHQFVQIPPPNYLNTSLNSYDKARHSIIELIEQYCSNKKVPLEQCENIINNIRTCITNQFIQRNQAKTRICEKADKAFANFLKNNPNDKDFKVTEFGQLYYTDDSNNIKIIKKLCTNERCTKSHEVITKKTRSLICVTNLFGCCIYGKKCNHVHSNDITLQNVDIHLPEIVYDEKDQVVLEHIVDIVPRENNQIGVVNEDNYISIFWYTNSIRIFYKTLDKTLVLTDIDYLLKAINGQSDNDVLNNKNQIKNLITKYFTSFMENKLNLVNIKFSQIEPKKDIKVTIRDFIIDLMLQVEYMNTKVNIDANDYDKLVNYISINKINIKNLVYNYEDILSSALMFSSNKIIPQTQSDVERPWDSYTPDTSISPSLNNSVKLNDSIQINTTFDETEIKEQMSKPVHTFKLPSSLDEQFQEEMNNIQYKRYYVDYNFVFDNDTKFIGKFICDKNDLIIFFENRTLFNQVFMEKMGNLSGQVKYEDLIPTFSICKINIFDITLFVSSTDKLNELLRQ